jgi:hypothetical protein
MLGSNRTPLPRTATTSAELRSWNVIWRTTEDDNRSGTYQPSDHNRYTFATFQHTVVRSVQHKEAPRANTSQSQENVCAWSAVTLSVPNTKKPIIVATVPSCPFRVRGCGGGV